MVVAEPKAHPDLSSEAARTKVRQHNRFPTEVERVLARPTTYDHTLQITSYGGSGTNALIRHFEAAGLRLPASPGHWPFKHGRPPSPDEVSPGYRVVYLHGDPRNTVVSLFRRDLHDALFNWLNMADDVPDATRRHLASLDAFAEGGVDEFGFERHLDRWRDRDPKTYPVLFVRYERIEEAWPAICEFVGLPTDYPVVPLRARESDWTQLPEPLRGRLGAIYERLAARVAAQPPAELG
jgi:hypothetical protein